MLATIHAPSLIPRRALTLLLAASWSAWWRLTIRQLPRCHLRRRVSAATLYALALLIGTGRLFVRERAARPWDVIADKLLVGAAGSHCLRCAASTPGRASVP
jgi:3'-phosphoadenosine 5'-phosphosulfate (PAPS) 3'-phosphatase